MSIDLPVLKPADFGSDQDVRWCPGCGDYSILAQMKKALAAIGDPRENTVFISCLLYTSPSPRDLSTSRMPSSA